ncbi:hypothetical protein V6N11_017390 [Hibiscus sabdariffa]|uniref:Uncharacterized protein n=1 Tax=Hibiscus sabdariffa TaxID=183260 RepID=A0ABR2TXV4_9ROSI
MIGIFDPAVEVPCNPRKHRRLDDDPLDGDGGGGGHISNFYQVAVGALNPAPSYKESLMKDSRDGDQVVADFFDDEDIDLQDGDITRSIVDGLVSNEFSGCVQSLAEKSLDHTLVVKLLGRSDYTQALASGPFLSLLNSPTMELWVFYARSEGCSDLCNAQASNETKAIRLSKTPSPSDVPTESVSFGPWMVAA